MSWYYKNINGQQTAQGLTPQSTFRGGIYSPFAPIRDIVYTMKISDMERPEDAERISTELMKLEGISSVNPILYQNKLSISFNPTKASISHAARVISELGYHYTQRGCKGCH
jgi:hypothetical protein